MSLVEREMIVSIHLPKCAGESLQSSLRKIYGDKAFLDYGDAIVNTRPGMVKHREKRKNAIIERIGKNDFEYDVIHGHFYAQKYIDILSKPTWITVMRNPFELIPSYYNYLRRTNQDNLLTKTAREADGLVDFIRNPLFHNIQGRLISPLEISDFKFIGVQEYFELTMECLEKVFGKDLPVIERNRNPQGSSYQLSKTERLEIIKYNKADLVLYEQAKISFFDFVERELI